MFANYNISKIQKIIPMQTTNKHNTLAEKIERNIYIGYLENHLTKKDLVQILILLFDLLNIMTISKYAKKVGKTYRGVKNFSKDLIKINDFTFVSDNY